jgi:hypothetical protein
MTGGLSLVSHSARFVLLRLVLGRGVSNALARPKNHRHTLLARLCPASETAQSCEGLE